MKKQAQLIFANFGEEKQRLKAKEERLELEIALNKLALYDIREEQGICQEVLREELITDCNEEFADNVLMRMQLENLEFEEAFDFSTMILHCYGIRNFYFSKEEVRKWVERKIERTIGKYGIGKEIKIRCITCSSLNVRKESENNNRNVYLECLVCLEHELVSKEDFNNGKLESFEIIKLNGVE